jgi:hypothetical protein
MSASARPAANLRRYETLRQQLSESQALEDSLRRELEQLRLRQQIQALEEVSLRQQIQLTQLHQRQQIQLTQLHQMQEELSLRQEILALQEEMALMQQQAQRLSEQRGNRPVAVVVTPARLAELPRATVTTRDGCRQVCSVCQGEVCPGEVQVALPCSHSFQEACITQWLGQYDSRCPNCMRDVR